MKNYNILFTLIFTMTGGFFSHYLNDSLIPVIICFAMKIIVKKEYYYHGLIIIFLLFFATYSCNKLQMHKPWLSPKSIISIENLNFEDNATVLLVEVDINSLK